MRYKTKPITIFLSIVYFSFLFSFALRDKLFFLTYTFALTNILLLPKIRKKLKYPYLLHVFWFYFPFYCVLFFKPYPKIFNIEMYDKSNIILMILTTIILLLINKKAYLNRITGISSRIKIEKKIFTINY